MAKIEIKKITVCSECKTCVTKCYSCQKQFEEGDEIKCWEGPYPYKIHFCKKCWDNRGVDY